MTEPTTERTHDLHFRPERCSECAALAEARATADARVDAVVRPLADQAHERDAEIRRLREVLDGLRAYHEGYADGMGPCICGWHQDARALLADKPVGAGDGYSEDDAVEQTDAEFAAEEATWD